MVSLNSGLAMSHGMKMSTRHFSTRYCMKAKLIIVVKMDLVDSSRTRGILPIEMLILEYRLWAGGQKINLLEIAMYSKTAK